MEKLKSEMKPLWCKAVLQFKLEMYLKGSILAGPYLGCFVMVSCIEGSYFEHREMSLNRAEHGGVREFMAPQCDKKRI